MIYVNCQYCDNLNDINDDLVSRQAVINALYDMEIIKYRYEIEDVIRALPAFILQKAPEDVISRQEVIKAMCDTSIPIIYKGKPSFIIDYMGVINTVPPIKAILVESEVKK